jgi:hypothetical protein
LSIPRILGIAALLLFIVFVATFFTVLVRLSRVGVTTERYAVIRDNQATEPELFKTRFDLLGQNPMTGGLIFKVKTLIDTEEEEFSALTDGQKVVLRIDNLIPETRDYQDLVTEYSNLANDRYVTLNFGEFELDTFDRRDFYPFDGYILNFTFAIHITRNWVYPNGIWFHPKETELWSQTNLIFLHPRYGGTEAGIRGFKVRVARLRILQFLAATLILIEVLFILYLLTIVNLQELLGKGLGYLVGLYIIRDILTANAPQFPTIVDYGTLFLICVVFFLMLFKFLAGAEENAIITIPPTWREALGVGTVSRKMVEGKDETDHPTDDLNKTG